MPTFIGGPAEGETIPLTRSPKLLRIAQNGPFFRALDALDAEPEYTELLYVYQRDGRGSEEPERVASAVYRYLEVQPRESRIFLNESWWGFARSHLG